MEPEEWGLGRSFNFRPLQETEGGGGEHIRQTGGESETKSEGRATFGLASLLRLSASLSACLPLHFARCSQPQIELFEFFPCEDEDTNSNSHADGRLPLLLSKMMGMGILTVSAYYRVLTIGCVAFLSSDLS